MKKSHRWYTFSATKFWRTTSPSKTREKNTHQNEAAVSPREKIAKFFFVTSKSRLKANNLQNIKTLLIQGTQLHLQKAESVKPYTSTKILRDKRLCKKAKIKETVKNKINKM
jgi:hypothetical protein